MMESRPIFYQSGPRDKYHCGFEYPPGFLSQADSTRNKKYPRLIFTPKPDVTTQGENSALSLEPYFSGQLFEENSSAESQAAPTSTKA